MVLLMEVTQHKYRSPPPELLWTNHWFSVSSIIGGMLALKSWAYFDRTLKLHFNPTVWVHVCWWAEGLCIFVTGINTNGKNLIGFNKFSYKGAKPSYPFDSLTYNFWHIPILSRDSCLVLTSPSFSSITLISNYLSFLILGFSNVEKKHRLSLSFSCTQKSSSQRISLRKWFDEWRQHFWKQAWFPGKCSSRQDGLGNQ